MNHDELIERLAPLTDEEAARLVSPRTRNDLRDAITATEHGAAAATAPARPGGRRRLLLLGGLPMAAVTAAGAVTTLALVGPPSGGTPKPSVTYAPSKAVPVAAALSFATEGRYLVVRIKDPLADPGRYAKEFAARGMDIKLSLVPASPSVVGTVVMDDMPDGVEPISTEKGCYTASGGACVYGMRIPRDFHGSGEIAFGRAARPGEPYASTNSAFAEGEALHCARILGLTVDQAVPVVRDHKVTVGEWHYDEPRAGGQLYGMNTPDRGKIPGNWYVTDADPLAPGQVSVSVAPSPPPPLPPAVVGQRMRGCPR